MNSVLQTVLGDVSASCLCFIVWTENCYPHSVLHLNTSCCFHCTSCLDVVSRGDLDQETLCCGTLSSLVNTPHCPLTTNPSVMSHVDIHTVRKAAGLCGVQTSVRLPRPGSRQRLLFTMSHCHNRRCLEVKQWTTFWGGHRLLGRRHLFCFSVFLWYVNKPNQILLLCMVPVVIAQTN